MPTRDNSTPPAERSPATAPRFAMPDVVGVVMRREEIARVVQASITEMAAGLECSRLVALSYVPEGGQLRTVATMGLSQAAQSWHLSASGSPALERAVRTGRIEVLSDSGDLPTELAGAFVGGAVALIPLALGNRVLAMLVGLLKPGVPAHTLAWSERASEVAARAALVAELQRVASAYQDEIRLRQSSRTVAAAMLEGRPLTEIADIVVETVASRLREDRVALYLRDPEGHLTPIALRNISAEYGHAVARLPRPTPMVERAVATRLPYHARDFLDDARLSPELRILMEREGVSTILIALLQQGCDVTGSIAVYPRAERQFTPAELSVFQSFADLAALAVAMTRQLEVQREEATSGERNRLAREMHDTVAQSLTAVVLQVEMARTLLDAGNAPGAREMLETALVQSKRALEDTRRAVKGLSPAVLDRLSAAEAIAEEVRRFELASAISAPFILTGEEQPLLPEQQTALLRIAQEGLTNVRKHAAAHRVRVGLQFGAESIVLLIEDDGVGFDARARPMPDGTGGYGLFGMMERARLLGGDMEIESTPGWGTRIRASLPFHPASQLAPGPGPAMRAAPMDDTRQRTPARTHGVDAAERPLQVLVVDDHAVTRQGVRAMLEFDRKIAVTGEAADGEEAIREARRLRPDVVLMDLQMPGMSGLEAVRRLRIDQPELPVVILTTFQSDESVAEALSAGARGYLLKDASPDDLVAAVRAAHRGEALFAPSVVDRLADLTAAQPARTAADALNERETEILKLLAAGARNKEIAARLFIAPKTVEYHLANVFTKLGVSNRVDAARVAIERGIADSRTGPAPHEH